MERRFSRALANFFSLPKEAVLSLPVLTFLGREEAVIENVKKLLTYTGTSLRIQTRDGILSIAGQQLEIGQWKEQTMVVRGVFCSVGWEEETR